LLIKDRTVAIAWYWSNCQGRNSYVALRSKLINNLKKKERCIKLNIEQGAILGISANTVATVQMNDLF